MTVSIALCKKRLAILWLLFSAVLFLVVFLQTVFGRYGDKSSEAWSWLLPTIAPTCSLIVTVYVMEIRGKGAKDRTIDRFFFRLAFISSIFYLLAVALIIFLQPLASYGPLELMKLSNLALGPLQGVVAALIGAFFVKGGQA